MGKSTDLRPIGDMLPAIPIPEVMPVIDDVAGPADEEIHHTLAELYARLVARIQAIKKSLPEEELVPQPERSDEAEAGLDGIMATLPATGREPGLPLPEPAAQVDSAFYARPDWPYPHP